MWMELWVVFLGCFGGLVALGCVKYGLLRKKGFWGFYVVLAL